MGTAFIDSRTDVDASRDELPVTDLIAALTIGLPIAVDLSMRVCRAINT